jgi:hypothetical protein
VRPVDEQQARLVERLRAADGAPVTFEELRSQGIENPATLCYELEAAGLRIARVHSTRAAGRAVPSGVRLEEPASGGQPPETTPSRPAGRVRTSVAARPIRPWHVGLALAIASIVGATLALTHHTGGAPAGLAKHPPRARTPFAASPARHPTARRTSGTHRTAQQAPSPAQPNRGSGAASAPAARPASSPVAAAQLQAEGHQQLGEGRYTGAVGNLRAALAVSGESLDRCTEPAGQACITYAYALYDLGRALRLAGHPTAAVPVLRERLRIDNQRPTVRYELDLAREQLHTVASMPPPGPSTHG